MEQMREIVDIRTVDAAIRIGGAVWFGACLLVGAVVMVCARRGAGPLIRGLFVSLIGPVVVGLWLLHSWMTRYDPQTGYYGLDKVWVLVVSAVVFVAIGAAYGYVGGRLWACTTTAAQEANAPPSAKEP
jgi:hypothetical protein